MYDVSERMPVPAVRPGTNLLVTGPGAVSTYELVRDLLATGFARDQAGVVVSTDRTARSVRADVTGRAGWKLAVVDCVSDARGEPTPADPDVTYVASPTEFSGIGMGTSAFLGTFADRGIDTRFVLDSLSTMLREADVKTVFRFLHILTGRISGIDGLGVVTLDEEHSGRTTSTLGQLFDGVVEIRTGADSQECRVRCVTESPTPWTEF